MFFWNIFLALFRCSCLADGNSQHLLLKVAGGSRKRYRAGVALPVSGVVTRGYYHLKYRQYYKKTNLSNLLCSSVGATGPTGKAQQIQAFGPLRAILFAWESMEPNGPAHSTTKNFFALFENSFFFQRKHKNWKKRIIFYFNI